MCRRAGPGAGSRLRAGSRNDLPLGDPAAHRRGGFVLRARGVASGGGEGATVLVCPAGKYQLVSLGSGGGRSDARRCATAGGLRRRNIKRAGRRDARDRIGAHRDMTRRREVDSDCVARRKRAGVDTVGQRGRDSTSVGCRDQRVGVAGCVGDTIRYHAGAVVIGDRDQDERASRHTRGKRNAQAGDGRAGRRIVADIGWRADRHSRPSLLGQRQIHCEHPGCAAGLGAEALDFAVERAPGGGRCAVGHDPLLPGKVRIARVEGTAERDRRGA